MATGVKLNCLKFSARRFSSIPAHLPQRTRNFSSHLVYSHCSRNSYGAPFPITARAFSIWPISKSPSPPPPPETPSLSEALAPASLPKESAAALSDSIPKEPASALAQSLPEGLDLSPPVELLSPDIVDAAVNVSSLVPPALQYGDLAALGLISWTPAGLARWSYELINVSTGLPWFWTIVAGTLFWRLVLFPVVVKSSRASSRMVLIQPQLQELSKRMTASKERGDTVDLMSSRNEMLKLYTSAGVSPGQIILGPLVQIPVAAGIFIGLKKMCELPVPQLAYSGVNFLPDLTATDPTGIMAPAFAVTLFWQMTVAARDMDIKSQPGMAHFMNLMRFPGAPIFAVYMYYLPSGLVVSLLVAAVATGLQSMLLRVPAVRSYFNILPIPEKTGRTGLPSFKDTWLWLKNKAKEQYSDVQRRQEEASRKGPPRRRL